MDSREEYVSGMLLICKGDILLHASSKTVQSMFVFHVFDLSAFERERQAQMKTASRLK